MYIAANAKATLNECNRKNKESILYALSQTKLACAEPGQTDVV